MQTTIKFVNIWTGWLRLAHWVIAAAVIFLILSAWAQKNTILDQVFWHDWHLMVGQMLIFAVLLRIVLLFTSGSGHWKSFMPTKADYSAMSQMLRFYLSFARTPLPNWYAHNPLWKPVYILFYVFLLICLITGILHDSPYSVAGMHIDSIHATSSVVVTLFTAIHILAVFLHDLKGKGALVSAMVSGNRYFHIDPVSPELFNNGKPTETIISFDSLGKITADHDGSNTDKQKGQGNTD